MCRRVYNYTADAYGELASSVRLFFQNLNVAHFLTYRFTPGNRLLLGKVS